MEKLSDPGKTAETIKKYDFCFRKKFGQNFLIDARVLEKIIEGAGVCKDDMVLEIGPGIGTLTQYLAEAAGKVVSVEIDRNLLPILEETLAPYDNVKVISSDIMALDLKKLIGEERQSLAHVKVVANLPYYITTPIIMMLLEQDIPVESITVMVQKEVARRMNSGPGSKDYGALSLAVQYYARPYLAANVPRNCFMPRPNVDSAVIRLTKYETPPVSVSDPVLMFDIIHAAFEKRRKTLVNGISSSQRLDISKAAAAKAIEEAGFAPAVRGEALTLEEFARLADIISAQREKETR